MRSFSFRLNFLFLFRLSVLLQGLQSLYQIKIVEIEHVSLDFDENYLPNADEAMGISMTLAIKNIAYTFLFDPEHKLCDIKLVSDSDLSLLFLMDSFFLVSSISILQTSQIFLNKFLPLILWNCSVNALPYLPHMIFAMQYLLSPLRCLPWVTLRNIFKKSKEDVS